MDSNRSIPKYTLENIERQTSEYYSNMQMVVILRIHRIISLVLPGFIHSMRD